MRPNDPGSSNSFDKRRVKAQIGSLLLPELTSRRSAEYVADLELGGFCELEKDAKSDGASRQDDVDDGVGMKRRRIVMALLSLVSLILESLWMTSCPRGRGRMVRGTRTRICTVLVDWPS